MKITKNKLFAIISVVVALAIIGAGVLAFINRLPDARVIRSIQPVGVYKNGMLKIKQGEKFGFMDTNGSIAIPCIYDDTAQFEDGLCEVMLSGEAFTIDRNGTQLSDYTCVPPATHTSSDTGLEIPTPSGATDVGYISEGLASFTIDGKMGFIDLNGNVVIEPIYQDDSNYCKSFFFNDGLAAVKKNGKFGFIDKEGNEAIPFIYDNVHAPNNHYGSFSFEKGIAFVCINGKWGGIDKQGNEITPMIYDYVNDIGENEIIVGVGNTQGLIDRQGNTVIEQKYVYIRPFYGELAQVRYFDKSDQMYLCGFIDRAGNEVVPLTYKEIFQPVSYDEDFLYTVSIKNGDGFLYAFLDKDGNEIVTPTYDYATDFSNGMSSVMRIVDGLPYYGYVNTKGEEVVPCQYVGQYPPFNDGVHIFSDGLSLMFFKQADGSYLSNYIKTDGSILLPEYYELASTFNGGFATIGKYIDGVARFARINTKGELLTPFIYNTPYIPDCTDGFGIVTRIEFEEKKQLAGIIDQYGNEIIPTEYDHISSPNDGGCFVMEKDGKLILIESPAKYYTETSSFIGGGRVAITQGSDIVSLESTKGDATVDFNIKLYKAGYYFAEAQLIFNQLDSLGDENRDNALYKKAMGYFEKALEHQPESPYLQNAINKYKFYYSNRLN